MSLYVVQKLKAKASSVALVYDCVGVFGGVHISLP